MEEPRPRPKACPVCGGKAKVDRHSPVKGRFSVTVRCLNSCNGRKDRQKAITVTQQFKEKRLEMIDRAIGIWNALPRPEETKVNENEAPD